MKRFLGLVLLLTCLFCSCHTTPPAPPAAPDSTAAVESVELSSGEQTSTEEETSSVRYVRDYEITELQSTFDGSYYAYVSNGYFYYFTTEIENKKYIPVLVVYNSNGEYTETVYPVEPTVISERAPSADAPKPIYAYALSEARWFLIYNDPVLGNRDMYITDENGKTLARATLPKQVIDITVGCISVAEDDSGVHIGVCNDSTIYYYDVSLELIQTVKLNEDALYRTTYRRLQYAGNAAFTVGYNLHGTYLCNMLKGSADSLQLRLPILYYAANLSIGADGQYYLQNSEGILKYQGSDRPDTVLKWSECGLWSDTASQAGVHLWVLDDDTVIITSEEARLGSRHTIISCIRVSKIQSALERERISIVSLTSQNNPWLAHAIYRFNMQNDTYYAELNYLYENQTGTQQYLENALLMGTDVDILIPSDADELSDYYDKSAFLDLKPMVEDWMLGGVLAAMETDGAIYTIPMGMTFSTLLSADTAFDGVMTWDSLHTALSNGNQIAETIAPYQQTLYSAMYDYVGYTYSPAVNDIALTVYPYSLYDFYDTKAAKSSFASTEFHDMVELLGKLQAELHTDSSSVILANDQFRTTHNNFSQMLTDGTVPFVELKFSNPKQFLLLSQLFNHTAYNFCGYPGTENAYAIVTPYDFFSVFSSTDVPDGCREFLRYLLSDQEQTQNTHGKLPVTQSAFHKWFDENRYQYYQTTLFEDYQNGKISWLRCDGTSAEYANNFGYYGETEPHYTVVSYSEEEETRLLHFLNTMPMRMLPDETVFSIVTEELSAWKGGIRTLDETTKIIDSRVWIYLNE